MLQVIYNSQLEPDPAIRKQREQFENDCIALVKEQKKIDRKRARCVFKREIKELEKLEKAVAKIKNHKA